MNERTNALKTAYLLGVDEQRLEKVFGYELDALDRSGVFEEKYNILRAATTMRSILLKYFKIYIPKGEQHISLSEASEGRFEDELMVLEQFNIEESWGVGYLEAVNKLTQIVDVNQNKLVEIGIENADRVFDTYFKMPILSKKTLSDCCKVISKWFREYPLGAYIPRASRHGDWLRSRLFNDMQLYKGIELSEKIANAKKKIDSNRTNLFNINTDYGDKKVVHYLDGENNHPFHLLQVAKTAPKGQIVKLFCETYSGVIDIMSDTPCEKYVIDQVVKGKSQVDNAIITTMAIDHPEIIILHSSDSDYLYTVSRLCGNAHVVVVASKQATAASYIEALNGLDNVEVYLYDEAEFPSEDVNQMITMELNHLLKNVAFAQWETTGIATKLSNTLRVPVAQVEPIVSKRVKYVKEELNRILGVS